MLDTGAMLAEGENYREILRGELEGRMRVNPRYSLRAFARDLEMAPSRLSEILNAKQGLSHGAAKKVAKRLGYNFKETALFCDLVESLHARSKLSREVARIRLQKHAQEEPIKTLQLDAFKAVSDWHHFAILCLVDVHGFDPEPDWIGRKLQISRLQATTALARLERLELIERKSGGGFRVVQDYVLSPSGIPSEAIKKFHKQVLEKAAAALVTQSLEEREFSTVMMSIDQERLPEVKQKIREFGAKLVKLTDSSPKKDQVYCFSTQFFRITQRS